ncbi:type II toxin-antitoxin system RelE/ParE family toxin [Sorangium sp. So ce854]|uniref:type II toxin-antitoxin system RelE/ParE family toxin n=1 Tax=Sorangium sp. So ce854 TaxID=3133322 RepID=UPI003F5EEC0E
MNRRAIVRVTENFERNPNEIRRFLEEIGFDFLARAPQSAEVDARVLALKRRLGPEASLREYIAGDYLLLYTLGGERIHLLAIKHHRQLSFDLQSLWRR